MKATKYLKDMIALYYATNDVEILEDITEYLGINWAEFVYRSEMMQANIELFKASHQSERETRRLRKVYKL